MTGLYAFVGPELEGKRLALLKEAVPHAKRVAVLTSPKGWSAELVRSRQSAAAALGLQLISAETAPNDYARAFAVVTRESPDAIFVGPDPYHSARSNMQIIIDFASRNRLPLYGVYREWTESGALLSYGNDPSEAARIVASQIDRILKGAKPADLPVEQPTKFELVINLKTAKALGLTIPPSLLARADQVIE
jgi:putative ABC transport system substrate-binding protein